MTKFPHIFWLAFDGSIDAIKSIHEGGVYAGGDAFPTPKVSDPSGWIGLLDYYSMSRLKWHTVPLGK
jgi:hypothetical protein